MKVMECDGIGVVRAAATIPVIPIWAQVEGLPETINSSMSASAKIFNLFNFLTLQRELLK
jgi:hypothetical protein